MVYSVAEIEREARVAFEWARKRRNKVTSVTKPMCLPYLVYGATPLKRFISRNTAT